MSDQEKVTFRHTPDMGEISGFGGGYEKACQDMLEAGVNYIHDQKLSGSDVQVTQYANVFGICFPENKPTKALEDAVVAASGGDCTGAMVHAVMGRLAYIAREGWDKYCDEVRKHEAANPEPS